jgi:hypothetical protein
LLDRIRAIGIVRRAQKKRKLVVYSAGSLLVAGAVAVAVAAGPAVGHDSPASSASLGGASAPPTDQPDSEPHISGTPSAPTASSDSPEAAAPRTAEQDDPVDAAVRLLAARFDCFFTQRDAGCLEPVLQPGSAIDTSDRASLRKGGTDPSVKGLDFRGYEVSMLERMGDAALLALTPPPPSPAQEGEAAHTKPASLLIVRGEAGWRLRELFEN